jgi:hypothetical protein
VLGFGSQPPAWWRLNAGDRRWALVAGAVTSLFVLAGGFACQRQTVSMVLATQALAEAQQGQAQAQQRLAQAAAIRRAEPLAWWAQLPSATPGLPERSSADQFSADALALAPKLGVQVLRLSISQQPAEDAALYRRTAVQVELKGAYGGVKRWLSELLARRPHALALRSLDVRRGSVVDGGGVPAGIEATVELRLFERVAARPASPSAELQRP